MKSAKSPVAKEDGSSNGHHSHRFSESNQSAFRRISAVKSDPVDMVVEKSTKNGTSTPPNEVLPSKLAVPNSFLPPLITSSSDFHSHLALLRPFLSQSLPFLPPLPPTAFWHTFPFLHSYLSGVRPPGFGPLPPGPTSLPPLSLIPPPPLRPKASTSASAANATNNKKPSAATHYHQYTITNNNVLVPSSATLMDFIRQPTISTRESTSAHASTSSSSKSKNLKKYKCDICSRAFSRSNTLVTHKRIHTGEKPFICDVCDRAFRQPGNLTRHKLTHTTAKPFACTICAKAFNRASNLHAHQRTHALIIPTTTKAGKNNNNNNNNNNGHGPYTCTECHEEFEHKFELNLHTAALHGTEVKVYKNNNNDHEEEEDDEEDDAMDEEQSDDKDEEETMSDNSDQDIDLLEN